MTLSLTKNATRIITGTVIGLTALWCLLYGGIALLALIFVFVYVGSKEYVQILKNNSSSSPIKKQKQR